MRPMPLTDSPVTVTVEMYTLVVFARTSYWVTHNDSPKLVSGAWQ